MKSNNWVKIEKLAYGALGHVPPSTLASLWIGLIFNDATIIMVNKDFHLSKYNA